MDEERPKMKPIMKHSWTPEDDEKLLKAVEECEYMRDAVPERDAWWAMVAGRAGLYVTPDSARTRWQKLRNMARKRQDDAFETAEKIVESEEDYRKAFAEDPHVLLLDIRAHLLDIKDLLKAIKVLLVCASLRSD